jgi:CheY-like chemotaxis protein
MNVLQSKLLILDDELANRDILRFCLGHSYELVFTTSMHDALAKLQEDSEHIVLTLCAIHLQDESAFDFMYQMRAATFLQPVVLYRVNPTELPASIDDGLKFAGVALGAVSYITSEEFHNAEEVFEIIQACIPAEHRTKGRNQQKGQRGNVLMMDHSETHTEEQAD